MSNAEDTFISHLIEMRDRLLRAVIAVVVLFVCLLPWAQDLYALLAKPMLAALPQGGQMIATEVTTPFFVPIKVTMMTAFLLALPWVFYQAWAFVAPGLYQHEKRLGVPLVTWCRATSRRSPRACGPRATRPPPSWGPTCSIGASAWPSRVIKGKGLPGHYGAERQTMQNIEIVDIRPEDNILLVRGAVPGPASGLVAIRKPKIVKKK